MATASTEILKIMDLIRKGKEPNNKNFLFDQYKLFYELGDGDFNKGAQIYFQKRDEIFRENKLNENPNNWIFREVLFRGTPPQFVNFIERLETRKFRGTDDSSTYMLHFDIFDSDKDKAHLSLCPRPRGFAPSERPSASIYALTHPDGYSKITLECYPDDWIDIEKYWDEFVSVLRKENLILEGQPNLVQKEDNLTLHELMELAENGDKSALKKIQEIAERVIDVLGKPILEERNKLLNDPYGKIILPFLENQLKSDNPLARLSAGQHSLNDLWDLVKKYPKEAINDVNKVQTHIEKLQEPPKPPQPKNSGGKIEIWLDWYHAMLDNGYKCTLEEVASKSGYSLGYIKQKHMVYQEKSNQNT